jgi:hypothetical protein
MHGNDLVSLVKGAKILSSTETKDTFASYKITIVRYTIIVVFSNFFNNSLVRINE